MIVDEVVKTVCGFCGVGCGLEVELINNQPVKLKGDKNYEINGGLICSKGASQLKSINKNRLLKAMFRENINSDFREISMNEAIDIAVKKIKNSIERDPKKIGFYLSGQLLNEDYYLANKLAKGFIKTNNVDTNSRTCMASAVVGYKKSLGFDFVPITQNEALKTELFIIIGSNMAESHVVLFNKIKKEKELNRGLKIVVIDPRKTKTAEISDLFIDINIGKDVFLLNALAKKLLDNNLLKPNVLLNGLDIYLEKIKNIDINENLKIAGVSHDKFNLLFEMWKNANNIVSAWTMGINQSSNGVAGNLAIINLHLLTGQIFKDFSGPLSLTGQPNAMGGREVGGLATTLAVHLDYSEENIKKVENFWQTENMPRNIGLTAFEMFEKGNLEVLLVSHTDPVFHLPNRNLIESKIKDIDFVIELNAYTNSETSKFAHLLIPALPFGEKNGTQTNLDRLITLQNQLTNRTGEGFADWQIFAEIGKRLGFNEQFDYKNEIEIFDEYREMTKLSPDLDIWKVSYSDLKKEPFRWGKDFKIEKANIIFPEYINNLEDIDEDYPFMLLTGRINHAWHSSTKFGQEKYPVQISKIDANNLNIINGDKIIVESRYGKIVDEVEISANLKAGIIFIPMHNREVNRLTNSLIDNISKEPEYKTAVKIIKI